MKFMAGTIAIALALIWFPVVGQAVAMVTLMFAVLPVKIIDEKIAPLTERVGKSIGQPGSVVTLGLIVSLLLGIAAYCIVRAGFEKRNADAYAGAALSIIGLFAIAASSYYRFKFNY
jgi:hypothetical protein